MLTESIPQEIREKLEKNKLNRQVNTASEDLKLVGTAAFEAPREDILIDTVIALYLGKNVLLKGPTGSGKTKLAEHVSALFNQPMHAVNCSTDLDAEALLGFKTLSHDEQGRSQIVFIPGPIMKAMTKGHFLYIDEINMAKPETLSLINGVLDYRRSITNPFTGEVITAHPDFRVVAAINEGYMGTVPLNEALKNRFVTVDVPYLQGEALYQLLKSKSILREDKQLRTYVQLSADLLTLIEMGQLPDEAGSIRALLDACDLTAYIPPMRAVSRAIADKLEDERERAAVINAAETLF
ncbi:ATP-binding protein [Paenibacillus planticolens]|uniref:AAA domain-containing protein n=1 Tax=Paenibacillus planticolens TaxID=2654976 RepID=A0ABX1ZFY1_9BACL|nr:MoxR family ATPase [Paenibacillus planticolens]NOU98995.1 AAA domain-containing protein [Paenibacillus planticolens]